MPSRWRMNIGLRRKKVTIVPVECLALFVPVKMRHTGFSLVNCIEIENNISRKRGSVWATVLAAPNVPGYSFDQAPNLSDAQERKKLSENAIKVFREHHREMESERSPGARTAGRCGLFNFSRVKTKPKGKRLDQDTLTRISLVIGIYKALNIYFGKPWADRWITLENRGPLFAGQAPIGTCFATGSRPGGGPPMLDAGGRTLTPPVREFGQKGMHRLIPSRYSETGPF